MLRPFPMFPNYLQATRRRGAGRLRWSGARTTTRGCPCRLCLRSGAHRWRASCAGCRGPNYNPFGLPGDACGTQGACPIWHADGQMAGLVGAFAAAQAARESNRPLLELFRDCLEISFQADDGPRPRDEGANQGDTRPTISRTTSRAFGFDHCPTGHVTAAARARISPVTPTPETDKI